MAERNEKSCYINRELSWLRFNERVLDEASDPKVPILEKMKFISIFCSNLDEFYMIRVGSLFDQSQISSYEPDNKTGMDAKEQLQLIFETTADLIKKKTKVYKKVIEDLAEKLIVQVEMKDALEEDIIYLKRYFNEEVLPFLSPSIIDNKHPFPHLENKATYVCVNLKGKNRSHFGIIPINKSIERLIVIPTITNIHKYVLLEDLIHHFAKEVFSIYNVEDRFLVRVTRNADIDVDSDFLDEEMDYKSHLQELLKERRRLAAVRLEVSNNVSKNTLDYLANRLNIAHHQIFTDTTPFDLSYVMKIEDELSVKLKQELLFEPLIPQITSSLDLKRSIIPQVLKKDLILSYPYESMKPFLTFLKETSEDPDTISLKITLYRVSSESKIIEYLINAAENGKDVTAVVELRARFDEENNIQWAKRLEEAGCRVVYGLEGYKVHSKVLLVTRKINNHIQTIAQIGTGNYNEKTAKVYTDLCLITSNEAICTDISEYFKNMLIGNSEGSYNVLIVAPTNFRQEISKLIDREIEISKNGGQGYILIKINSLTDKVLIDKMIEASENGVKIDLIIRGICCLQSGLKGCSKNIRVVSIVGRYLEHSRVFCFGTPERQAMYISSADWMTRNTTRRFEIACPIFDDQIRGRLFEMLNVMLKDNTKARVLNQSGKYKHIISDEKPLDSQIYFFEEAITNAKNQALKSVKVEQDSVSSQNAKTGNRFFDWVKSIFNRNI